MTTGKGFPRVARRCGNIFQAVMQIVGRQRGADLAGEGAFLLRPERRAVVLQGAIHRRLERAVWQIA